jgi:membrane protein
MRTIKLDVIRHFITEVTTEWREDKGWLLSAAMSFYSLFSLAPLLIIIVAGAGLVVGWSDAEERVISYLRSLAGDAGTRMLEKLVLDISPISKNVFAAIAGLGALFIGASTFFSQLRHALNQIWKIRMPPGMPLLGFIKGRFIGFLIALATGVLVLVSLLSTTVLSLLAERTDLASGHTEFLWKSIDLTVAYAVLTVLFALLYKYVPDAHVRWKDVWIGAIVATILFNCTKYLFSLYLSHSSFSSAYGAAGSLVVFLVWLYLASQIFLIGAECVQVWARYRGHPIKGQ